MNSPSFFTRRQWLQTAAAFSATAAGLDRAHAASPQAQQDLRGITLRVGTYKGLWRPLLAAAGQADTPYKIDWRELNNGVLHIEAINGDALDLGSGSEIPAVFAARQKAERALRRGDARRPQQPGDAGAQGRTDPHHRRLQGQARGLRARHHAHYYLAKQLAEAGLSFADIQPVSLTPADGLSAFARGDLDAWAIYGYNGQLARTQYGARTIKTGVGYLSGNFPIYANPRTLDDPPRRAAVADLLQRLQRSFAWINGNYLAYARAQSAETRVPVGDIDRTLQRPQRRLQPGRRRRRRDPQPPGGGRHLPEARRARRPRQRAAAVGPQLRAPAARTPA